MNEYDKKKEVLQTNLLKYVNQDTMVAFSGGVDSSLLLKLVCQAAETTGRQVYAVTMQTKLHPVMELENAEKVALEIGAKHLVIQVDELLEAGIEQNPKDRCYLCKKRLFVKMKTEAERLQIHTILDGTNEDDLHVYRPGLRALKELGIVSPLADAGFTKAEVRMLAKECGLSVSSRPAMPCLATRFPYGTRLSYEELQKVEQGEEALRAMGFYNVRLRIYDQLVRIEVDKADFEKILSCSEVVVEQVKALGYSYVTLDLEGFRSGSMDIF
ncbi:MAG: ATP-dependent sacrificial sulfur transferase LarE [Hespellia sp.]|nr:ATP-dependent sacrificial sulfur transferase LarE [Hespellia sp.]